MKWEISRKVQTLEEIKNISRRNKKNFFQMKYLFLEEIKREKRQNTYNKERD